MARVTWQYIESAFYQRFTRLTRQEQHGVITGLRAIMLSGTSGAVPEDLDAQEELFAEEDHAAASQDAA